MNHAQRIKALKQQPSIQAFDCIRGALALQKNEDPETIAKLYQGHYSGQVCFQAMLQSIARFCRLLGATPCP